MAKVEAHVGKLVDQIGSFTTVPNSVVKRWKEIGLDAMGLFLYLRYRTNGHTEVAFPSYDTIRDETGLSRNRIARAIRVLEKASLVERRKRFGQSTVYTLKCPPVQSSRFRTTDKDASSPETGLHSSQNRTALVPQQATNKTELNKTENNKKKPAGEKPPSWGVDIQELMQHFSEKARIALPVLKTSSDYKAAQVTWVKPLQEIKRNCNGRSAEIITSAIAEMRRKGLTCAYPKQIVVTALSKNAETQSQTSTIRFVE